MKLAVVTNGPLSFDGETYLSSRADQWYIDRLAPYFSEVLVCAYTFRKGDLGYLAASEARFRSTNVRVLELPFRAREAGVLPKLWRLFQVFCTFCSHLGRWDLLYIFMPGYPAVLACLVSRLFRKPYFVYLAADWTSEPGVFSRVERLAPRLLYLLFVRFNGWVEREIVRGAFLVITAGAELAQKFASVGQNVQQTFPRLNLSREEIFVREDACLTQPIRLLFVGSIIRRKGLEYLLRALASLIRRACPVVLTVAGSGDRENELRRLAKELQVGDAVQFIGHARGASAVLQLYREHDIYVLPTLSEGFPRTLYEAMSQSIPIVTTAVGGIPHLMKHEENALLVPTRSPEAIVDAVLRLMSDPPLRRKLIANGVATVKDVLGKDPGQQIDALLMEHFPPYQEWARTRGL